MLNRLLTQPAVADRKLTDPRAVILAPTRELAIQIDKDFRNIGRDTGLTSALIYGGVDYEKQRDSLRAGCDIIIATPGRLIDYLKQHVFSFRGVEALVIDEADRMFDLGFIKDIRFLLRRMPPREQRQGMLFSATLSHRVLELAYEHMNSPEKLTAETETVTASRVRQVVYFPGQGRKAPAADRASVAHRRARAASSSSTPRSRPKKSRARSSTRASRSRRSPGDVPQAKRERLLAKFQRGEIEVLVATDVAARGLHIPAVSHVFNYDLPHDAEDYVHRIGRTARLGAEGDAISFACDLYAMGLPDIEAYIEQKIPVERIDARNPDRAAPPRARRRCRQRRRRHGRRRTQHGRAPPQQTAAPAWHRTPAFRSPGRSDRVRPHRQAAVQKPRREPAGLRGPAARRRHGRPARGRLRAQRRRRRSRPASAVAAAVAAAHAAKAAKRSQRRSTEARTSGENRVQAKRRARSRERKPRTRARRCAKRRFRRAPIAAAVVADTRQTGPVPAHRAVLHPALNAGRLPLSVIPRGGQGRCGASGARDFARRCGLLRLRVCYASRRIEGRGGPARAEGVCHYRSPFARDGGAGELRRARRARRSGCSRG